MGIEFFKRIKEAGKKLASKTGAFIQKGAKYAEKLQPVLKVVSDFIPYGDVIEKGVELGTELAERGGNVLKKIGDGRNVFKALEEEFDDFETDLVSKPVNNYIDKLPENQKQKVQQGLKTTQKVLDTSKKVVQAINNNTTPKINRPSQFITNRPVEQKVEQPSFMSNVLNDD